MERVEKPFFANFEIDFLFSGGLSFVILAICWGFGLTDDAGKYNEFSYYLAYVCNWPHFAATFVRFYGRKSNVVQNPIAGWGSLLIVIGITYFAFVEQGFSLASYIRFYFAWSAFHYCMQGMGLTQLYFLRGGTPLSSRTRNVFFILSCLVYFSSVMTGEMGVGSRQYLGITYPTLNLPIEFFYLSIGLLSLCFAFFLWCLDQDKALRSRYILFNMIPFFSVIVWFLISIHIPVFQIFVPFFHCLQYLQVAWESEKIGKTFNNANGGKGHFFKWYTTIVIVGLVQFIGLPYIISEITIYSYGFCIAVVGLAVQIHHFLVDGFIWKLRDKENKTLLGVRQ